MNYGDIEVISVGNGSSDYVGNFTKEENAIIQNYLHGYVFHLFSGNSQIGNCRIDFDNSNATLKSCVFEFLNSIKQEVKGVNTVILDPPYSKKFGLKYQKLIKNESKYKKAEQFLIFANARKTTELFNLIREKINPERIIMKSWNFYIPKGYYLRKGYCCYAGGYRKPTFLLILDKKMED